MKLNIQKQAVAEVIESSLNSFKGQCWQWDIMPAYGSIVIVESKERTLFGLVYESITGSHDSGRSVFAYKKSEEDLKQDHPHIFELLTTTIQCLILGYEQNGTIRYQLPPEPAKIHAFIRPASPQELERFFLSPHFLHTLFFHEDQIFSVDDLILALLQNLSQKGVLTSTKLDSFIETFSLLTANDYRRLKLFLQRAQSVLLPEGR